MRAPASAAVVLGFLVVAMPLASANAAECYAKQIRAKGGTGLIQATAKSRARTAWIKKVRADRRLGKEYAAWLRARSPTYACRKSGKRFVCEAAAIPCRLAPKGP